MKVRRMGSEGEFRWGLGAVLTNGEGEGGEERNGSGRGRRGEEREEILSERLSELPLSV